MQDTKYCPICSNKLKNLTCKNYYLYFVNQSSNYVRRSCTHGMNHNFQIFTDLKSKKVSFVKVSLIHDYSKFLEMDLVNNKSRILCIGEQKNYQYIELPKTFIPDFPDMKNLKEKLNKYILLS